MKNKTISIIITVIFTIFLLFSTFYLFYPKIQSSSNTFTFAWMSDTQYYSESHPEIFDIDVNYILDYKDRANIKYAIHTGDIVDDINKSAQWKNANNSLKLFDDSDMPYGVWYRH